MSLWPQVTTLDPGKTAATSILRTSDVARQVCITSGKDPVTSDDGVQQIPKILRGHVAPDALDAMYPNVVRFLQYRRTHLTVDAFLLEFAGLRH